MSQLTSRLCHLALIGVGLGANLANADVLPLYGNTIDYRTAGSLDSKACASYGDVVSCSATLLNVLHGNGYQTQTPTGYAIPSPQGELKGYIVIDAGGNAALDNSNINPTGGAVESGYFANTQGNNYFMTGNGNDPTGGLVPGDTPYSWDISIAWLIQALTIGDVRREMVIGFDFNQPQNGDGSLDIWSLITVRDIDSNPLTNKNYELNRTAGPSSGGYGSFSSGYDFTGMANTNPKSTDFVTVVVADCVQRDSGGNITDITQIYSGQTCPSGYTEYRTSISTKSTEFINFLPELSDNLESLLAQGYDTISVQLRMGCFGNMVEGNGQNRGTFSLDPKSGPVLSDNLPTTNCDGGGYGDVYLLAGSFPGEVPEPGSLALAGLGLVGLAALRRRKQA